MLVFSCFVVIDKILELVLMLIIDLLLCRVIVNVWSISWVVGWVLVLKVIFGFKMSSFLLVVVGVYFFYCGMIVSLWVMWIGW